MADRPLTHKQQKFIHAYLGEAKGNATEAARRAGYASPKQQGSRLLTNVDVAARVAENVEKHAMSSAAVLDELASIATAEWKDFVRVSGRAKNGEATAVQSDISSKVKALELLGKYHQLFVEKQQIDINVRDHRVSLPQSTINAMFQPSETNDEDMHA